MNERLDRLLGRLGVLPRSDVPWAIRKGRVLVAGSKPQAGDRVDPDEVRVDGQPLLAPTGLVVLHHKVAGTVCTASAHEGLRAIDALPAAWRRPDLQPVGRLDRDTTGALVFTNRGDWAHRWVHPKHHLEKVYIVDLDRDLPPDAEARVAAGLTLHDGPCRSASLVRVSDRRAELTLTEGRTHQVKRMMHALGVDVVALFRHRFGPWTVDNLAPGESRIVAPPA